MNILKKYDIKIEDTSLINQALTHSSYYNENPDKSNGHNERLEFLGDSVLGIVVSEMLYYKYPKEDEGFLTKLRSLLVRKNTLVKLAHKLEIPKIIKLGSGEIKNYGNYNNNIIADCTEAFFGAVFLSTNLNEVKKIIVPMIEQEINDIDLNDLNDYKTKLQEYVQSDSNRNVFYVEKSPIKENNQNIFTFEVYIDDLLFGVGSDYSKKKAQQNAAKQALIKLVK